MHSIVESHGRMPEQDAPVFVVPAEMGTVDVSHFMSSDQDRILDPDGKAVIYIADAHDSLEAQENIARLIRHFVHEYNARLVLEEGYEGPVPTDEYFGGLSDEARQKAAYFLMDRLRLGGAEYAHITRTQNFDLIGADSIRLHRKNVELYRRAMKYRKKIEKELDEIQTALERLAETRFPSYVSSWLRLEKRFQNQELDLLTYLDRSQEFCRGGCPLVPNEYPQLFLLQHLRSDGGQSPVKADLEKLDARLIFDELEKLGRQFVARYLPRDADRRMIDYLRFVDRVRRLCRLAVTYEEYDWLAARIFGVPGEVLNGVSASEVRAAHMTQAIADFLARETGRSIVLPRKWERYSRYALEFYRVARERDAILQKHLKEVVRAKDSRPVIVVYGGFHQNRIVEQLRRYNFSYAVVTPKISAASPRHEAYYTRLMNVGRYGYETPYFVSLSVPTERFFSIARSQAEAFRYFDLMPESGSRVRVKVRSDARSADEEIPDDDLSPNGIEPSRWNSNAGRRSDARVTEEDVVRQFEKFRSYDARAAGLNQRLRTEIKKKRGIINQLKHIFIAALLLNPWEITKWVFRYFFIFHRLHKQKKTSYKDTARAADRFSELKKRFSSWQAEKHASAGKIKQSRHSAQTSGMRLKQIYNEMESLLRDYDRLYGRGRNLFALYQSAVLRYLQGPVPHYKRRRIKRSEIRSPDAVHAPSDFSDRVERLREEYVSQSAQISGGDGDESQKSRMMAALRNRILRDVYEFSLSRYPEVQQWLTLEDAAPEDGISAEPGSSRTYQIVVTVPYGLMADPQSFPHAPAHKEASAFVSSAIRKIFGDREAGTLIVTRKPVMEWLKQLRQEYERRKWELWELDRDIPAKMKNNTELADEMLLRVYWMVSQLYPDKARWISLLAVGSYARGEMTLGSDVDGRIIVYDQDLKPVNPSERENVHRYHPAIHFIAMAAREIFGHETEWKPMAVDEPVNMNVDKQNLQVSPEAQLARATELLDARYLDGFEPLAAIRVANYRKALESQSYDLVKNLIMIWNEQYTQGGFLAGLYDLQPHVKDSVGGLRAMHYARWVVQAYTGHAQGDVLEALPSLGFATSDEVAQARKAFDFMLRTRRAIARVTKAESAKPRLALGIQPRVAAEMGYENFPKEGILAEEQLMQDYYRNSLVLFHFSYTVIRRVSTQMNPVQDRTLEGRRVPAGTRIVLRSGKIFQLGRGYREIPADKPEEFLSVAGIDGGQRESQMLLAPEVIMPIFLFAVSHMLPITGELHDLIYKSLHQFRRKIQSDTAFRQKTYSQLRQLIEADRPIGYVIERMHLWGVLTAILPDYDRIVARTQPGIHHRLTRDAHSIQTIKFLDTIIFGGTLDDPASNQALRQFRVDLAHPLAEVRNHADVRRNIRAALLFDAFEDVETGLAAAILRELGYNEEAVKEIQWVIDHREGNGAQEASDTERYSTLIREKAAEDSGRFSRFVREELENNFGRWIAMSFCAFAEFHETRPDRFWLYAEEAETLLRLRRNHIENPDSLEEALRSMEEARAIKLRRVFEQGLALRNLKTDIAVHPLSHGEAGSLRGFARIEVYHRQASDRPGRLAGIAGSFAANGLEIVSLDMGTTEDENAADPYSGIIDVFIVRDTYHEKRLAVTGTDEAAWRSLEGELVHDLTDALELEIPVWRLFERKPPEFRMEFKSVLTLGRVLYPIPPSVEFTALENGKTRMKIVAMDRFSPDAYDKNPSMILFMIAKLTEAHGINNHTGGNIDTEGYDPRIGLRAVDHFIMSKNGRALTRDERDALRDDLLLWLNKQTIDGKKFYEFCKLRAFQRKVDGYIALARERKNPLIGYLSDVHGDFEQFMRVLREMDAAGTKQTVVAGDHINRGNHGLEVMEEIRRRVEAGSMIALMGNHELQFIHAILGNNEMPIQKWLRMGGWAMVEEIYRNPETEAERRLQETVPLEQLRGIVSGKVYGQDSRSGSESHEYTALKSVLQSEDGRIFRLAKWMAANLKLFYEDENLGLSFHAGIGLSGSIAGTRGLWKPARMYQREKLAGREALTALQALWDKEGYSGQADSAANVLNVETNAEAALLWLGDWYAQLKSAESGGETLAADLSFEMYFLRIFFGHVEAGAESHLKIIGNTNGQINPIDFSLSDASHNSKENFGGYALVGGDKGQEIHVFRDRIGSPSENVYSLNTDQLIAQAEAVRGKIYEKLSELARSETRTPQIGEILSSLTDPVSPLPDIERARVYNSARAAFAGDPKYLEWNEIVKTLSPQESDPDYARFARDMSGGVSDRRAYDAVMRRVSQDRSGLFSGLREAEAKRVSRIRPELKGPVVLSVSRATLETMTHGEFDRLRSELLGWNAKFPRKIHFFAAGKDTAIGNERIEALRRDRLSVYETWQFRSLPKRAKFYFFGNASQNIPAGSGLSAALRQRIGNEYWALDVRPGAVGTALLKEIREGKLPGLTQQNGFWVDSEDRYSSDRLSEISAQFAIGLSIRASA